MPEDIESPIIIVIPDIAKTIEIKPTNENYSLRYKKPNSAKNIVCVLIIKTTFATDVFIIANTNDIKLKDIIKPPSNPGRPELLIILKVFFLYIKSKKVVTPIKKKKVLKNNIFRFARIYFGTST